MSWRDERFKAVAVVALFAVMIFWGYLFNPDITVDEFKAWLPDSLKAQVDGMMKNLPPDEVDSFRLPLPEVKFQGDFMSHEVIKPGEMEAMGWILNNTNKSDKFVADIFGGELIMGMTTRVSTTGGDWGNQPDALRMMTDTWDIYRTGSPWIAHELARDENADYVFVPQRSIFTGWWVPQSGICYDKFEDGAYFEKVYANDDASIYRVK